MHFLTEVNHFYYQMTLRELRHINEPSRFRGLSHNSILYLDVISQTPQCTVSKLAGLLGVTKSAVTLKVNELVRNGFLLKAQSETDGRVHYLSISGHFSYLYEYYDKVYSDIGKILEQRYSQDQMQLFCEMLHTVAETDWTAPPPSV